MEITEKENVSQQEVKTEIPAQENEQIATEKKSCCKNLFCKIGSCKQNWKLIAGIILLVALVGSSYVFAMKKKTEKETADVKNNVEKFIKDNLVQPGTDIIIKDVVKEGALYKITVSVGKGEQAQETPVYATTDGKLFLNPAIDMNKDPKAAANEQAAAPEQKEIPKNETPTVELFVMSYCPYGTQIEKGILPVLSALGNKVKFSLKFVDYAMHGEKEIVENTLQYCIEKNQPTKLNAYLTCFLKKGEGTSDACMKTAGVNAAQVASCIKETDVKFKTRETLADKSSWNGGQFPPFNIHKEDNEKYGVKGSPALVVNGVEVVGAPRDAAGLQKTICGAFNNQPKECEQKLSSTSPAPGFGEGAAAAGSASAADCASN